MPPLVHPASLFRFRFPVQRLARLAPLNDGQAEASRLPNLAGVVGVPDVAMVSLGWHPDGLVVRATLRGVGKARWCHATKPEDSDGLQLWVATRPTAESHRAGRFCRRLAILPAGGGRQATEPLVVAAAIPRATIVPSEDAEAMRMPLTLPTKVAAVSARSLADGWQVDAVLSAAAMPGWDPEEQATLGFFAAVVDRRLGQIPLFAPPEYPWDSDPTTWSFLELTG